MASSTGALAVLLLALPAALAASNLQGHLTAGKAEATRAGLNYPSYPGGPGSSDDPDSPDGPSWPSWPGGPSNAPATAPLSIRASKPVHVLSYVLRTTCDVAPADAPLPFALKCDGVRSDEGADQDLVFEAVSDKLYDGSVVQLRSLRRGKLCSVGGEEQRFAVTCDTAGKPTAATDFVIRRAAAHTDLYYLAPAAMPSRRCYPSHSPLDPSMADQPSWGLHGDAVVRQHVVVCDGQEDGDQPLLHIMDDTTDGGVVSRVWDLLSQLLASAAKAVEEDVAEAMSGGDDKEKPATAGGDDDDDDDDDDEPAELPFSSGSTIVLSDPSLSNDGYDCDVTSSSPWFSSSSSGSVRRVLRAKKTKGGDQPGDSPLVQCDHDPAAGKKSFWKTGGFMVFADYAKWGAIKEGDSVDLRSQGNFRYCTSSKADKHVVSCTKDEKDASSKFEFYLVPAHEALKAWKAAGAGKKRTTDEGSPVPVYVKHTASKAYCAAATARAHAPFTCKYDLEDAPVVWLKVSNPYPGGPPTPSGPDTPRH